MIARWGWPASTVPAVTRHIGRGAQREPDVPRRQASIQCLLGRAITDVTENEVTHERAAVRLAEFVRDGAPEF